MGHLSRRVGARTRSQWTLLLAGLLLLSVPATAAGQETARSAGGRGGAEQEAAGQEAAPRPEQTVTHHSVRIGGETVRYTATAGTFILRDEDDEPAARIGYTAYTRDGVSDMSRRPITFAYNGGPGSSSIWLHMGALGPRRVVVPDTAFSGPPPYTVVDNAYSILDRTDLVMIDPVGTGLSRALGDHEDSEFWGVDPDIRSVSRFIAQYVSATGRWNSPRYLLGESYGTTRSAGMVDYLQSEEGMTMNGVVLVSVALDLETLFNWAGNERPYPLFLPTYAAVARYHDVLPERPEALEPFLDEVRAWALGPYAEALAKGDDLSDEERDGVAAKLHQYTGLSEGFLRKANLRVDESEFTHQLLEEHGVTVGRLDARFVGPTLDPLAKDAGYDPQSAAIRSAYTAAFLHYLHQELDFGHDRSYTVSASVFGQWEWEHRPPGARFPQPFPNTGPDLAHAMKQNPHLEVLVLNGYYDLATPFLATEYMMSHLMLDEELQANIEQEYYEAGHMMYVHEASLRKMKEDVASFIDRTSGGGG